MAVMSSGAFALYAIDQRSGLLFNRAQQVVDLPGVQRPLEFGRLVKYRIQLRFARRIVGGRGKPLSALTLANTSHGAEIRAFSP